MSTGVNWPELKRELGDASMAAATLNHLFLAAEAHMAIDLAAEIHLIVEGHDAQGAGFDELFRELPVLLAHLTPGARQAFVKLVEDLGSITDWADAFDRIVGD